MYWNQCCTLIWQADHFCYQFKIPIRFAKSCVMFSHHSLFTAGSIVEEIPNHYIIHVCNVTCETADHTNLCQVSFSRSAYTRYLCYFVECIKASQRPFLYSKELRYTSRSFLTAVTGCQDEERTIPHNKRVPNEEAMLYKWSLLQKWGGWMTQCQYDTMTTGKMNLICDCYLSACAESSLVWQ